MAEWWQSESLLAQAYREGRAKALAESRGVPPEGACTRGTAGHDMIGAACPVCGHTNLVHPGLSNPSLSSCAVCQILLAIPKEPT